MATLRIHGLDVTLNGNAILRGLNLDVADGEFVVLLGPSGCGKSTLLHSIAGLIDVDGGRIEIDGADLTRADPSARGIGMVFQSYALYPTMTVEGNLSFGLRMAGVPKAEIALRVARAAAMLELDGLLKRRPAQLSGGQRQRVAIGRALVRDAGLFLFDEPLSNLDAQLRAQLRREIKLLHQRLATTTLYVTHDQAEALTLATRLVVLRDGKIQQQGAPADVYARPENQFVAGFLGAPAINLVTGTVGAERVFRGAGLTLPLPDYAFRQAPGGEHAVTLGVRPEQVRLGAGPLRGTVSLTEPMGSHQIVWIDGPGGRLAALGREGQACRPGEEVPYMIDSAGVSLFDRLSERRL